MISFASLDVRTAFVVGAAFGGALCWFLAGAAWFLVWGSYHRRAALRSGRETIRPRRGLRFHRRAGRQLQVPVRTLPFQLDQTVGLDTRGQSQASAYSAQSTR